MGEGNLFFLGNPDGSSVRPFVVFDAQGGLHSELNQFVPYAAQRLARKSLHGYLSALTGYFQWLERSKLSWAAAAPVVQQTIARYLVEWLDCQVRDHPREFMLVALTKGSSSSVALLLAALRLFYQGMIAEHRYVEPNPLIALRREVRAADDRHPRMPLVSGVSAPDPRTRLSDNYFVLTGEQWQPRIIDDVQFPARVFQAGRDFGWRARERLVTRLLFETGARVSEVCGLTLGDWLAQGLSQGSTAFSKGSRQRRVKILRWSQGTTTLLRRYFDADRCDCDPEGKKLAEHLHDAKGDVRFARGIPLFLTQVGRALSASTFRDLYWRPALTVAGINADIHQIRHWYVTQAVRQVHSDGGSVAAIEQQLDRLVKYMGWKSGRATLVVYQHYFDALSHSDVQASLHRRLDRTLKRKPRPSAPPKVPTTPRQAESSDWQFLARLGGQIDAI